MDDVLTLWILVGIPGSGKTTYARKLWKLNPSQTVRICLDEIIQMVSFYSYDSQLRSFYGEFEYRSIIAGLVEGHQVIVDRTNLTPNIRSRFLSIKKRVQSLAQEFKKLLKQEGGNIQWLTHLLENRLGYYDEEPLDFYYDAFFKLVTQKDLFVSGPSLFDHLDRLCQIRSVAIYFDVPLKIALSRRLSDPINRLRDMDRKSDWKKIVKRMHKELIPPTLQEGFDEIITLDADFKEIKRDILTKPNS